MTRKKAHALKLELNATVVQSVTALLFHAIYLGQYSILAQFLFIQLPPLYAHPHVP